MQYNSIIFDFGNVIINFSINNAFNYWAEKHDKKFEDFKNSFTFDCVYNDFEKGLVAPGEYKKHVEKMLNLEFKGNDFKIGWNKIILETIPGIIELLTKLKKKYRLVLLTNTNKIHFDYFSVTHKQVLIYFESIFASHIVHARKPEKEIYTAVLDYLKVDPAKIIFFDDMEQNIQAAKELGIKSILVKSFSGMLADLKKAGVKI